MTVASEIRMPAADGKSPPVQIPPIRWGSPQKVAGRLTQTESICGRYTLIESMGPRGMLYSGIFTPADGDRFKQRFWVERTKEDTLWNLNRFHQMRHMTGEAS